MVSIYIRYGAEREALVVAFTSSLSVNFAGMAVDSNRKQPRVMISRLGRLPFPRTGGRSFRALHGRGFILVLPAGLRMVEAGYS
jgi:hypothetical protein